ncbi:hypothetical protein WMY93_018248 [Mugilogobius chulae]|uniref:DDE Tnp4 domain-containing protein n=1 Tax=Mugilogobius chulae TaxID=88201 RepID=A0AAW0NVK3_9GOBI
MEQLLSIIGPSIRRQDTNYRKSISPNQSLAVTVRSQGNWRIAKDAFWEKWNFPSCIGALNGKHVDIQAPANSGSLFFDYKLVLMGLVDADYWFTYIHVGDDGRASDGGIFSASLLKRGLESKTLNVPDDEVLPGAEDLGPMPNVIVADAAFPLKTYLMRPYRGSNLNAQKQTFNYRLSRAKMVVECAFGILHNFLSNPEDDAKWLEVGRERNLRMHRVQREMGGRRSSEAAASVRQLFTDYFMAHPL